jgi:hypothetical protein
MLAKPRIRAMIVRNVPPHWQILLTNERPREEESPLCQGSYCVPPEKLFCNPTWWPSVPPPRCGDTMGRQYQYKPRGLRRHVPEPRCRVPPNTLLTNRFHDGIEHAIAPRRAHAHDRLMIATVLLPCHSSSSSAWCSTRRTWVYFLCIPLSHPVGRIPLLSWNVYLASHYDLQGEASGAVYPVGCQWDCRGRWNDVGRAGIGPANMLWLWAPRLSGRYPGAEHARRYPFLEVPKARRGAPNQPCGAHRCGF